MAMRMVVDEIPKQPSDCPFCGGLPGYPKEYCRIANKTCSLAEVSKHLDKIVEVKMCIGLVSWNVMAGRILWKK